MLILGGTQEAVALAKRLTDEGDYQVVTSLAGRTSRPTKRPGEVRIGGFGGVDGLAAYITEASIDVIIDATHPFAAQMAGNAALASERTGRPRIKLLRAPWRESPGDRWTIVSSFESAAKAVSTLMMPPRSRVFLATGYQGIGVFQSLSVQFLVRLVDPKPALDAVSNFTVIIDRGPFTEDNEQALFERYAVQAVVSKNSGGKGTYAKIAAARRLNLPVIMIDRPPIPEGPVCSTIETVIRWLGETS